MGSEFAQQHEWRHDFSLDWHENHGLSHGIQLLLKQLNTLYRDEPALYENNYSPSGFEWIDHNDAQNSVLAWIRKDRSQNQLLFIANFTPMPRHNYRIGAEKGIYTEVFNSDSTAFGGSGVGNPNKRTYPIGKHGRMHSVSLSLPPLGLIVLRKLG